MRWMVMTNQITELKKICDAYLDKIAEQQKKIGKLIVTVAELDRKNKALQKKADKLVEALEFYTDLDNIGGHRGPDEHNEGWTGLNEIPYGTKAKQALAEYRGRG